MSYAIGQTIATLLVAGPRLAYIGVRQAVRAVRRLQFAECGRKARFDPFGSYKPAAAMHFGSKIYIGPGARISAHRGFFMGDHSFAGPGLLVIGGDHNIGVAGQRMAETRTGGPNLPVRVEADVYLGARVTLLKGVTIGEGSVVGACSVVTRDVPPYTVAAGCPCRPLRGRFSTVELRTHLEAVPSSYCYDEVVAQWKAAGIAVPADPAT